VAATIPWSLLERKRSRPPDFTLRNVLEKTRDREDPWAGWRRRARSLDEARKRLADLRD
jgi:DNA primase